MTFLSTEAAAAQAELEGTLAGGLTAIAFVLGEGTRADQIAALAETRAKSTSGCEVVRVRKAAHVPAASGFFVVRDAMAGGAEVVFFTPERTIARTLRGADALDASLHEVGVASALAGDAP
jgi:hypothetical protein